MTGLKKVGANLLGLLGMFPQLSIVGAFTGSALLIKIAPLLGVAPKPLQQEVFAAYAKFIGLPLLHPVVATLGLSAQNVMLALALVHLVAVAMLLLPSGKQPAKVAGLWVMIAMAGAEYCTRAADVAPPMTPEEFKWQAQVLGTISHIFLFLCGAYCVARTSSLGLASAVLGRKPKAIDGSQDSTKAISKDSKANAKKQDKAAIGPSKADAQEAKEASRKRNSTPPPKAKKTK
eukprot:CAMPEP_0114645438 /NCGR_PEP_ID=MMETSP0191-20121206/4564_1 /TAXON_ID=126664 /ORGANISM="Sorites sp." /LENGTH=232 /DNA_ID=CAMNT_0001858093 /DNA_START=33 /DNA_END=731 /DNA_ORIENTATION=-